MTALILVAAFGAAVGIRFAYVQARRLDADLAELLRQADAGREQHHQGGHHVRRGGRGACLVCGAKDPSW